jgi:hypothetical protein
MQRSARQAGKDMLDAGKRRSDETVESLKSVTTRMTPHLKDIVPSPTLTNNQK